MSVFEIERPQTLVLPTTSDKKFLGFSHLNDFFVEKTWPGFDEDAIKASTDLAGFLRAGHIAYQKARAERRTHAWASLCQIDELSQPLNLMPSGRTQLEPRGNTFYIYTDSLQVNGTTHFEKPPTLEDWFVEAMSLSGQPTTVVTAVSAVNVTTPFEEPRVVYVETALTMADFTRENLEKFAATEKQEILATAGGISLCGSGVSLYAQEAPMTVTIRPFYDAQAIVIAHFDHLSDATEQDRLQAVYGAYPQTIDMLRQSFNIPVIERAKHYYFSSPEE